MTNTNMITVEFIYTADCGGNGGWIIDTVNGQRREITQEQETLEEREHFNFHLDTFGLDGWELVSIQGGEWVNMQYDYRVAIFRKRESLNEKWQYSTTMQELYGDTYYLVQMQQEELSNKIEWTEFAKQRHQELWEMIQQPTTINSNPREKEVIWKRKVVNRV